MVSPSMWWFEAHTTAYDANFTYVKQGTKLYATILSKQLTLYVMRSSTYSVASVAAFLTSYRMQVCHAVCSSLMVELSRIHTKAHLVLHICGGFCYDSCCIMALSQKLTQRLHVYIESLPNKLYVHADCTELGDV